MKYLVLTLTLLGVMLIMNNRDVCTEENAYFYFNQGEKYRAEKNYEAAIAMYKKAIKLNPDYDIAYNNLGCAYYEKGQFDEAIANYKKALEFNLTTKVTHSNLACAYYYKGMFDEAIEEFKKELENNPVCVDSLTGLGCAYYNKKMYEEAIKWFKKALEINPDYTSAKNKLASAKKAIEKENYCKYYNSGIDQLAQQNWEEAISSFNKALEYTTSNQEIAEKIKEAQNGLNNKRTKENYYKCYNSGIDQLSQQKYEDAISSFNQALEYTTMDYEKTLVKEKIKSAQDNLNKIKTRENYFRCYNSGIDQFAQQNWEQAILNLNQALEYAATDEEKIMIKEKLKSAQIGLNKRKVKANYWKRYNSGIEQMAQKRWENAINEFNNAFKYATTADEKGKITVQLNQAKRSLNETKRQETYHKWYNLGMSRIAQNRCKDAMENFSQALKYAITDEEKIMAQKKINEVRTTLEKSQQSKAIASLKTPETPVKIKQKVLIKENKPWRFNVSDIASVLLIVILGLSILPQSNSIKAKIYLWQKKYERAASIYEEAIVKGKKVWLYPALAEIYLKLDQVDEKAIKVYDRAIFLNAGNRKMIRIVADYYMKKKRPGERAIEIFEEALKFDPNNIHILNILGKTYCNYGEEAKAIDVFQKLYELGHRDETVVKNLAKVYLKEDRLDNEAILIYEEAMKYEPENHDLIIALSQAYINQGMRDKRTVDIYRKSVGLCSNLVKIYKEKNDFDKARRYAEIAYKIVYCYSAGIVDSLVRESVMGVLNKL
ncbi:MAG: tetratricopeptide repeat protein [bacterium]